MRATKERIFQWVFHATRYYAWWILIFILLITGAGAYYIQNLPLKSSSLDLLPRNDPLIDEYRKNEAYLAQMDYIALLLRIKHPDGVSTKAREETLLSAAEKIKQVLDKDPEFAKVTYLVEPSPKIPDQYLLLYQLDANKLARIEASIALARRAIGGGELNSLPPVDINTAYEQIEKKFTSALSGEEGEGIGTISSLDQELSQLSSFNRAIIEAIDGIDSLDKVTNAVRDLTEIFSPNKKAVARKPEGYFSPDRTCLLMNVRPRYPSQRGVAYCTEVTKALERDLASIHLPEVNVGATGPYIFNTEMNAVINSDMQRTSIISSVGVFIIFFAAFGSFFYTVIALLPLVISLILTMAWAKFSVGGFNLITTFLPALVLGLGIDYGIHLIARYAEERQKGSSFNRALYTAIMRKGDASLAAALTTSLVFVGLLTSRSRALFEMGVITSVGVLISFITTILLVPTFLTLSHFLFRFHHHERVTNYAPHFARYFRFVSEKGRAIFTIICILTFFVAFQAAHTQFRFSSLDLIPHVKSKEVVNEILQHFGAGSTKIGDYFTFFAKTEKELNNIVEHLSKSNLVESVESARDLLPVNLSEQQKILKSLNIQSYIKQLSLLDKSITEKNTTSVEIRTLLAQFSLLQYFTLLNGDEGIAQKSREIQLELKQIQDKLKTLDVQKAHEKITALEKALTTLDQNLRQLRDLPPVDTLLRDILKSLPTGIQARYITADGEYIIQARMSPQIYEPENLKAFDAYAASFAHHYFGMPLVVAELERLMRRDFFLSTIIALVLIGITLWRSMGGVIRALIAGSPLVLGYIWMLAGMRLMGIAFNFINITISPLLIGIGVDNGIHLIHRYLEERTIDPEGAIERSGQKTALALIVTSLTTMLVFGSLLIARTPGLRFLGDSALLGIGFTLLFSLLFLPAALRVFGKRV